MSITSDRKSLNSSILKSVTRGDSSSKKPKNLRFSVEISSIKEILKDLDSNPNVNSYQNLIYKLATPDLKDLELYKIISEAIESVPLITKDHILFVQTLLDRYKFCLFNRSEEIVELFHNFIINLLTSKSDFLLMCLSKIIRCFIPDDDDSDLWKDGNPSAELNAKLQHVHNLIRKILDVMPMLPVQMRKQIRVEFPYYKQPTFKIIAYIHNLLNLLDYCPKMIHDVLELIFENLLLIDVNVTREQIEYSEEGEDFNNENIEGMKHPVADLLDICMEKMLYYFNEKLGDDSKLDKELQRVMTQAIFHYFDEQILKTYTKHVHFMLFYIASFRQSFLTAFLDFLWAKVSDRNLSSTIRQTCIGYLSSFLSRANFLSLETVKIYLRQLSLWTHSYIKNCDFNRNKNPKAHVVFYAICQAIFYIIAFRSRELTRMDVNLKFLIQLDLWPIVKHPLNPLNVCLPAIATIFDNITAKYQILFCHTIIVNNASKSLTTVYATEQHRPEEILESVFPFDPYLLKRSRKIIQPLYIEYQQEEIEESTGRNEQRKRTRFASTSEGLDDFIIRDSKMRKV